MSCKGWIIWKTERCVADPGKVKEMKVNPSQEEEHLLLGAVKTVLIKLVFICYRNSYRSCWRRKVKDRWRRVQSVFSEHGWDSFTEWGLLCIYWGRDEQLRCCSNSWWWDFTSWASASAQYCMSHGSGSQQSQGTHENAWHYCGKMSPCTCRKKFEAKSKVSVGKTQSSSVGGLSSPRWQVSC